MDERLQKQLDFVLEIDKEKNIFRQTHLSGHGRRENDAEHAWHMAVMAYLLREYANEPVDIGRVMLMCLIHDIVEIEAGDTYAYDAESLKTQKAREDAAKEKIYSIHGGSSPSLTSLRTTRRRRPATPTRWTTFSPCCSTTATTAATGSGTR